MEMHKWLLSKHIFGEVRSLHECPIFSKPEPEVTDPMLRLSTHTVQTFHTFVELCTFIYTDECTVKQRIAYPDPGLTHNQ